MARVTLYVNAGSVAGGKGGDPIEALSEAGLLVTAIGDVEGASAVAGVPEAVTAAENAVAAVSALAGRGLVLSYDMDVYPTFTHVATALRAILTELAVNFPAPDAE